MNPKLIALYADTMQSGKSTTANILVKKYGFTLVKFADPLKEMTRSLLLGMGFDEDTIERMVEGDLKERHIPGLKTATPRRIMQTLGTEWGREAIENNLWVNVALKKADAVIAQGGRVVIDDMRFPNEYLAVRERDDSMLVVVERPGAEAYATHQSEGLLKNYEFDVKLLNDESLEVFQNAVDFFAAAIGVA